MTYGPSDPHEKTQDARIKLKAPKPGEPRFELVLQQGPGAPRHFPLIAEEIVVGRSLEATVSLDSEDLSRRHARFRHDGEQWTVEDLESRNGVFLNGVKVHFATLRHGDTIQLANIVMVLREVRE